MPKGNGRGPLGSGPMTGRGAGFCGGNGMPGYMNFGEREARCGGGGFGGGGHGWRNRYFETGLPGRSWSRTGSSGRPSGGMKKTKEITGENSHHHIGRDTGGAAEKPGVNACDH